MQIEISIRHGHVSDETQAKITSKVEKLKRFMDRISAIEVTVDLERKEAPRIDLRVAVEHTRDFVASEHSESLMAALDNVVDKMEQQLRKHKQKVQDRHRGPGHRQAKTATEAGPDHS